MILNDLFTNPGRLNPLASGDRKPKPNLLHRRPKVAMRAKPLFGITSDVSPSSVRKFHTFRRNYAKISTLHALGDAPIGIIRNIIGPIQQRSSSVPVPVLVLLLVLVLVATGMFVCCSCFNFPRCYCRYCSTCCCYTAMCTRCRYS